MAAPFRVGEEVEVSVDSLAFGGRGVARHDGVVVFVARALPGDRVRARVTKVKRRHAEAVTVELLAAGPGRVEAPCEHFGTCGGCRWQDLELALQLAHKETQVRDALERIGHQHDFVLEPIQPAVSPFRYRNKTEYTFTRDAEGELTMGFHVAGRWDQVFDLKECLLVSEAANDARRAVRDWAREQKLAPYDQVEQEGYARHLVIREGIRTGELLLVLVTAPGELAEPETLQALLAERCPRVVGVVHAINDGLAEVTSGLPMRTLFGRGWFEEEMLGLRLRVSAGSFLQTNTETTDLLYADAIEQAGLTGSEIVWDLYSGIGSIGLALAGKARRVIGVEVVEEAVERAQENALLNGVPNAEFVAMDAGKAPRTLLEQGVPKPDVVVVDPPRAGLTPKAVRRVAELGARRLVYVSCNPTTLAGNALELAGAGYKLERVRPFDLFPHTPHVECVARFERVEA